MSKMRLKKKIRRYMLIITFLLFLFVMIFASVITVIIDRKNARDDAKKMFIQVGRVLDDNESELDYAISAYRHTCISNAQSIAYMLQYNPSATNSVKKLKEIAYMCEVDEIHIFNDKGVIVKGTNPEYYGLSFDSGEQMAFFKPLLYDKDLELIQDITPNTAEGKPMQYSAVWSEDGKFILQIGMNPRNVLRITEKNELSYIFSLLKTNNGVDLYAVDFASGEIKGSTVKSQTGKNTNDYKLPVDEISTKESGFDAVIDGKKCYCIFHRLDDLKIGYVVSYDKLYSNLSTNLIFIAASLILVSLILVNAVTQYMDKYVIRSIDEINADLADITAGDLSKEVEISGGPEFTELSAHINEVITTILATTDKMSYVLNKTNMRVAVYEYNLKMKKVRFTDYLPDILGLSFKELSELTSDYKNFKNYIDKLKENSYDSEDNIYVLNGIDTKYIKLEEATKNNDTFGVLIDFTNEMEKRLLAENDRDTDALTGLLNRRGLNGNLAKVFESPEDMGYGALIMVDADGLKEVNDTYGHDIGDMYLRTIGDYLHTFGDRNNISGRLGGDEYVMLLYEYNTEHELMEDLDKLSLLQDGNVMTLEDGTEIPVKFSVGYSLSYGQRDYHVLMRNADEKMYRNKRNRKSFR